MWQGMCHHIWLYLNLVCFIDDILSVALLNLGINLSQPVLLGRAIKKPISYKTDVVHQFSQLAAWKSFVFSSWPKRFPFSSTSYMGQRVMEEALSSTLITLMLIEFISAQNKHNADKYHVVCLFLNFLFCFVSISETGFLCVTETVTVWLSCSNRFSEFHFCLRYSAFLTKQTNIQTTNHLVIFTGNRWQLFWAPLMPPSLIKHSVVLPGIIFLQMFLFPVPYQETKCCLFNSFVPCHE